MIDTLFQTAFRPLPINPAITLFALVFGTIWLTTNLYAVYPLVQSLVNHFVIQESTWRESVDTSVLSEVDGLPDVDIFIPAYQEAAVIENAVSSVCTAGSEYPGDVSLTVLLEPGDDETHAALDKLRNRYSFDVITIPTKYPGQQNKPRALNYGFEKTDGDIVGIVDAEDLIADETITEAAAALVAGADFAHGRLDMVNEDDGWLNLMFRAEYGFWYNIITPAFVYAEYPLPIAGTCCFFERSVLASASEIRRDRQGETWTDDDCEWVSNHGLEGVKPWNPQNVTEDFELGLTLWEHGYEFRYLGAVTEESSPVELGNWIKQRTRWKKGKLFTFFERLQNPPASYTDRAHIYWQSLLPHLGPINLFGIITLTLIGSLARYEPTVLVDFVLWLGIFFGFLYALISAVGYLLVSSHPSTVRYRRAVVTAVTLPVYWLTQWGADIRALWQTYTGRNRWEKTEHLGRDTTKSDTTDPAEISRSERKLTLNQRRRWTALVALIVLSATLRVFNLAGASLWIDELYSVVTRTETLAAILQPTTQDPHPPLYYALLSVWTDTFGTSPSIVRSLSVLFGIATIPAVYLLGTEMFDDRTGLIAALLAAVSPYFVFNSQTTRMYSLFIFFTAFSWYWLLRLRERHVHNTVGYLVTTALLVYTHLFGVLLVVAQQTYVVLSEIHGGITLSRWRRIQAILLALILPWFVLLAPVAIETGGFTAETTSLALTETALDFVGFPDFYPFSNDSIVLYLLASTMLFVYIGNLVASLFTLENGLPTIVDADPVSQMTAILMVVVVVPFVISAVVPIFTPRFAAGASVAFLILAATGLRNVPLFSIRTGLLLSLVISSLIFTGVYFATDSREPTEFVDQTIRGSANADDIIIHESERLAVVGEYYYNNPEFNRVTIPNSTLETAHFKRLRTYSQRGDTLFLLQYRTTGGPIVEYLSACRSTQERLSAEAFTIYIFNGHGSCPSPSTALPSRSLQP